MEWLKDIFGRSEHLDALQMSLRAFIAFFSALVLIRIAGLRTFGNKSAFDNVIMIILGAVLSRAIIGSSAFIPVLAACLVLVCIHRFLGWLSLYNDFVGRLVKGNPSSLFADKKENTKNMKLTMITKKDMMEGVRLQINENSTEHVEEIFMERNGEISVVKKT